MKQLIAATVVLLSISQAAFAQDATMRALSRPDSMKVAAGAYIAAVGADWTTTRWNCRLYTDGCESFAPAKPFVETHNPARIALGAALDVALFYGWMKLVAPHHPKLAKAGLWIGAGGRFWAAGANVQAHDSYVQADR